MHAGAAGVAVTYIGPNLQQAQGDFFFFSPSSSSSAAAASRLDSLASASFPMRTRTLARRVCVCVRLMLRVSAEDWVAGGGARFLKNERNTKPPAGGGSEES